MSTSNSSSGKANAWARPLPRRTPPGLSNNNNAKSSSSFSKHSTLSNSNAPKSSTTAAAAAASSNNTRNALRYRFLQLQLSLVGQSVTLTLKDGSILQGVFHTSTPFDNLDKKYKGASGLTSFKNQYVLKAVKIVQDNTTKEDGANSNNDSNSEDSVSLKGVEPGSTVVIAIDKVASLFAKSIRLDDQIHAGRNQNNNGAHHNGNQGELDPFKTDTDISHGGGMGRSADLVHAGNVWTSGPIGDGSSNNAGIDGALEDYSLEGGRGGGSNTRGGLFRSSNAPANNAILGGLNSSSSKINDWDQFSANEKKFGIKASFDEDLYTTKLDKSNLDSKKQMEAERLAREIEGTATSNIHLAEERGQKIEGDFDEEDLYSGVMVKGGGGDSSNSTSGPIKERKQLILKPRTVDKPSETANTTATAIKSTEVHQAQSKGTTETGKKNDNVPAKSTATAVSPVKKMNYAEAAAASKVNTAAPTKATSSLTNTATKSASTTAAAVSTINEVKAAKDDNATDINKKESKDANKEATSESKDEDNKKKEEQPKSKLNPNATKFVFNPSATEWKPSFGASAASSTSYKNNDQQQTQQQQQHFPHTEPQHAMGAVPMQQHYMHYQQMHPPMMPAYPYGAMPHRVGPPQYGMMPMVNGAPMNGAPDGTSAAPNNDPSNAPNTDVNNGTAGMDGNPSNVAAEGDGYQVNSNPGAGADSNDANNNEDGDLTDKSSQQPQPQVPPAANPQQHAPVNYVTPHGGPSGYYQQHGMPLPGRGPMQQYHPQMVGGHQQMPVQPGQPYYMQQMHQQTISQYQMRGNFPHAPYMQQGYNGAPRHGMMEEEGGYRGNGGRGGRGRGGGRRGGRRNSGGRGENRRYSNNGYMNNSIHQNDQETPEANADAS